MKPNRPHPSAARSGWAPFTPLTHWEWGPVFWDVWLSTAVSRTEITARAARRFEELVRFARSRSTYYAGLYRDLPATGFGPGLVPPVNRRSLMERFDDWVTDPEVTQESAGAFVADLERVGQPYLGRYAVWTSSGSSGEPGLFIVDSGALAVHDALEMLRLGRGPHLGGLLMAGGRYAMVAATGGHFAGVASVERMRSLAPAVADRVRVFSILEPLPRLVEALNGYQPTFIATYPSVASVLGEEQRGGRLRIRPAIVWLGGETLSPPCRNEVAAAFRCRVMEEYGASECMSIASECERGRLHLNSDWVMIEPVDRDWRPVPPGTASHTVLLTNLANRVQPIIRYDLGDSVVLDPEPCPCRSPFPVLRVDGREDDVLRLRNARGESVDLLPLALTTVVEEQGGAHQFQIVQAAPDALKVRLQAQGAPARSQLWREVERALRAYLDAQGLQGIALGLDPAPLERSGRGCKLRRVLRAGRRSDPADAPPGGVSAAGRPAP
jgi:phenylacetate-coenzyme A ligase PaaK-like adenylate-forming protein